MRTSVIRGVGTVCLLAAGVSSAFEQETPGGTGVPTLDSVVVTAMKREEKLVEVPTAVSVVLPDQINALHVQDARDLLTLIPTAYLQENNAGTARDVSIRGVSTPNLFAEAGVATYVDEVYTSGFISYPAQFYDLERV
jgi:iron complex outermembrane receptor protein